MKIVQLELLEDSILAGIDAMALVEKPAIEEGFFAFSAEKFAETYSDYPEAAVEAANRLANKLKLAWRFRAQSPGSGWTSGLKRNSVHSVSGVTEPWLDSMCREVRHGLLVAAQKSISSTVGRKHHFNNSKLIFPWTAEWLKAMM